MLFPDTLYPCWFQITRAYGAFYSLGNSAAGVAVDDVEAAGVVPAAGVAAGFAPAAGAAAGAAPPAGAAAVYFGFSSNPKS